MIARALLPFLPPVLVASTLARPPQKRPAPASSPNARLVTRFYNEVFNRHNVDYALKAMRPDYIQHNPYAATGRKAFMGFFRKEFKLHPNIRARIVRVVAQGDLVVLHVHSKIAEHWDAVQPVPAKAANGNTMF